MSQASMRKLAQDILDFRDSIPGAANDRKIDAVLAIENGLTQTTPIDTGAAISNWLVSADAPRTDLIEPYFPSDLGRHHHPQLGDTEGAPLNAQGAMELARAVCASAVPGQPIFIANNDPAIEATDGRGTSAQAAPGYVDRAIIAGVDTMSRAKLIP